jgi:two-component system nitrogen regulation response regulator NtrX
MSVKILIVDDEEDLVNNLQRLLLLEFPDCRVDAAFSGEEGLSWLADRSYDLLIADFCMPGFDGLELIKGVRYLDAHVPIVLMTGYGSMSIRKEADQLGVNVYMAKPFDIDRMLSTVRKLLRDEPGADG